MEMNLIYPSAGLTRVYNKVLIYISGNELIGVHANKTIHIKY